MARVELRNGANVEGAWFCDTRCIDCDASRQLAPDLLDRVDGLTVFRNCKIRATSNPTANTTDQSFLSYTLPEGGTPPPDTVG